MTTYNLAEALAMANEPVGAAAIVETLKLPRETGADCLQGVLLLRTHDESARELAAGEISVTLATGFLEVYDVTICVLNIVIGRRVYPVFLDALDPNTHRALAQVAKQGYLVLGTVSEGETLPLRACPLPSANPFSGFANPPNTLKRWTSAQYAQAVQAASQAFEGDLEGLLDCVYPRRSLAELLLGASVAPSQLIH